GNSVALSSDGNTALVGAECDGGNRLCEGGKGAAWVFTRSGSTWTQQGPKLTGSGEIGEGRFGSGVALAADWKDLTGGRGTRRRVGAVRGLRPGGAVGV